MRKTEKYPVGISGLSENLGRDDGSEALYTIGKPILYRSQRVALRREGQMLAVYLLKRPYYTAV